MDHKVTLGQVPHDAERDAVHVAVVPCVAGDRLDPGQRVRLFGNDTPPLAVRSTVAQSIGIVDPFLCLPVEEGQMFYLCLNPNSVTGLRHMYTHPALDRADAKRKILESIPGARKD